MRRAKNTFCTLLISFLLSTIKAQTNFYDIKSIQKIEINFTQANWDYQMDTAKIGSDGYLMARWVKINGKQYDHAGVKYKGNSSYDSTYKKNPIHIALDEFQDQTYQGFEDIKLSNGYADPSMIREVLSYDILKNYMHCSRSNFAQVYINGTYIGLYANTESIDKKFCSDHFYSSQNTFIKCNPVVTPGPTIKSNLKFIPSADSSQYFKFYEMKSDLGWKDLTSLCDTLSNHAASVGTIMDLDKVIWMLAFNNVLVNLDSYTGVFAQNYYLYKDNTNRFNPVVWDLNMSFGGFPFVGNSATGMGSLTIPNLQQLSPAIHATDPYWPLINSVMVNAMYKRMYMAHMRTITNEVFKNNHYMTTAAQLQATIDGAVKADSNKFFSYTQFQTGMTGNNPFGSYSIPGISNLMNARVSYLQSTADFAHVPPAISKVMPGSMTPPLNKTVTITAYVSNANPTAVYLGYRFNNNEKFIRTPMYDDGNHDDGAANDSVYGTSFDMLSAQAQYYIYAENNNAGMFSPERAEHEFYVLRAAMNIPAKGELVINEFLASNKKDTKNEYGKYADWIELYNNTAAPMDLFGLYLSDNLESPAKFAFPENAVIPPKGYLVLWADESNTTPSYIHCNFSLSGTGEQLIISDAFANVVDSVSFAVQSEDISMGRCANGTGPFTYFSKPSFGASNCTVGIKETGNINDQVLVYPNPARDRINIRSISNRGNSGIDISNAYGEIVYKTQWAPFLEVSTEGWARGIYFLRYGTETKKIVLVQ